MHSDFWVVVATVAPVVVLSCIVLCSTQSSNLAELIREWETHSRWGILLLVVVAAVVNLRFAPLKVLLFSLPSDIFSKTQTANVDAWSSGRCGV
jgi:hypothetical protein